MMQFLSVNAMMSAMHGQIQHETSFFTRSISWARTVVMRKEILDGER